ncbi:MAG: T9SS type A sorting domain-containing protein, partial [candidate division Zixibacteria bacterium]|nr:T9SS type A sorting domain-containing protein [candidate division Zixibacteria bacterium]
NLNEIANEIGDAVLYTNYFIYGQAVFDINLQGQIAASDVNNDGKVLTVGDLVYLIRVITGDAAPFNKLAPFANSVDVELANNSNGISVTTDANVELGGALFVFDDVASADVVPTVHGMDVKYDVVDGQLRVLVYDIDGAYVSAGENELFTVIGAEEAALSNVSIVDYYGADLTVNTYRKALPTAFALLQNSPNPFNPSTEISLDLPEASNWSIDIYNVQGQLVKSFSGYDNAGRVTVTWDAQGMASGIYFYRAKVGNFTDVRKMVLMK